MTQLLASVMSAAEADLALAWGADIIDLKNPLAGALGALPVETVRQAVSLVDGRKPVSTTIGDLAFTPSLVLPAVRAMAATGVDMVKIGWFEAGATLPCLQQLSGIARQTKLVLVILADLHYDLSLLPMLAQHGFYGVMLDTAQKQGGRLGDYLDEPALLDFVRRAQTLGLASGLAGSLTLEDAARFQHIKPDYLGFRGALCQKSSRIGALDAASVRALSELLHTHNNIGDKPPRALPVNA